MNRAIIFAVLFTGIAAMMVFSILPAMATPATGEIIWINHAEKHGKIVHTDDGTNNEYQFSIPRDLQEGYNPAVGDIVDFELDPENSRHATQVGGEPVGCPPNCGGSAI